MRDEHRKARARHLIATDYARAADFVRATGISKARVSQVIGETEPFAEDAAIKWEEAAGLPAGWFNNTWPTPKEAKKNGWRVDAPYPDTRSHQATEGSNVAGDETSNSPSEPPVAPAEESDHPPAGYIRLEHLSPRPAMGDGGLVDVVHVVRHLDVLEQWVRQKVGSANPERIQVLTAKGRSMMPTIQDQDLVFVDVWQKDIREPGIYVIDVAGRLLLKKALIQSTGTLILRSDNVDEYPDEERHDLKKAADTIHVSGRVLAWWTLRRG